MSDIIYTSAFVPSEWIAAHGHLPVRVTPGDCGGPHQNQPAMGRCGFAEGFRETISGATSAAAAVVTLTCDQMRRAWEVLPPTAPPLFLFHVPTAWGTPVGLSGYQSELLRLGRFLVDRGGVEPTRECLSCTLVEFDRIRNTLRSFAPLIPARSWAQLVSQFQATGHWEAPDTSIRPPGGIPLAVLGEALTSSQLPLLDQFEQAGGRVSLNATATGERGFPSPMAAEDIQADPIKTLCQAYFDRIPDVFRRPNSLLYEWLIRKCADRKVRGIVLIRNTWCDLWHAEAPVIKRRTGLPLLSLNLAEAGVEDLYTTNRLEAFLESLG